MNLEIRPALIDDVAKLLQIYDQALDNGNFLSVEKAQVIFLKQTEYPNYKIFVAELDNEVVGTFALLVMESMAYFGTPLATIQNVGVLPTVQGKGVGKVMMAFAIQYAKEKGCYKISLSSKFRREEAHIFYECLGFKKYGFKFSMDLV